MYFVLVFLLVSRMPVILIVGDSGLCGCVPCFTYRSVGRFNPPLSVPLQWVISVPVFLEGILLLCFCCCCFVLITSFLPCGKFGLPYLGKATAATRAALPIPIGMSVFLCVQTMPVWGIFNMRAHVGACNCIWWLCKLFKTFNLREPALKVDSRKKITYYTEELNLHQYRTRRFNLALLWPPWLYQSKYLYKAGQ